MQIVNLLVVQSYRLIAHTTSKCSSHFLEFKILRDEELALISRAVRRLSEIRYFHRYDVEVNYIFLF